MIIRTEQVREPHPANVRFYQHKFSERERPAPKDVLIICCFSEFGVETIGASTCIPKFKEWYPNKYVIVAGWYGRTYLYKHLADEYWELNEEFQYLRECCNAFNHESKDLSRIESNLSRFGNVIPSSEMSKVIVGCRCSSCGKIWQEHEYNAVCQYCGKTVSPSIFATIEESKKAMVPFPPPSPEKILQADKYLGKNPVGVFARNRQRYGRNLTPEFYVKLVGVLESNGYTPVWLGEKQSTLPCPVPHIVDFSRDIEARDLELTCAIVSKCNFTVQFWTASTRLASMVGTPFLLVESPDQILGQGQEGLRLRLTSSTKYKIVYSQFINTLNDSDGAIKMMERAIGNIKLGDWEDEIGMVGNKDIVKQFIAQSKKR